MIFFLLLPFLLYSTPFPIQFSIPEKKIVTQIPEKTKNFGQIIAGDYSTYIFEKEADYYKDYQDSYFGITRLRGGWDCLRHYEILANGAIPYFIDLENCPPNTMTLLPKELILEAMHLPGVSYPHIDHTLFDKKRYFEILEELLAITRKNLTTKSMASYLLKTLNYQGTGKILYLSGDPMPDYLRCCTLIGLKELLGDRVVDVAKIGHIYTDYPANEQTLYGKGFTYSRNVEDLPIDREEIEERILDHEFDLVIYGSVHRGLPFYKAVLWSYSPNEIVYLCGEDLHSCEYKNHTNLFLREYQ